MKKRPGPNCGKVIDIILRNDLKPRTSITNQMYIVGKGEAFVTVQCDKKGCALSVYCKCGKEILMFDDPKDALFISNACKYRLAAQIREQQKTNNFNKRSK